MSERKKPGPKSDNRHKAYAREVAKGSSLVDAYKKVYPASRKWKAESVYTRASLLRNRTDISQWVEEWTHTEMSKAIATVAERKTILTSIARGRVTDAMSDSGVIQVNSSTPNIAAIAGVESIQTPQGGVLVKMKMRDPVSAIDALNKMEGIGKDTLEVNQTIIQQSATIELASQFVVGAETVLNPWPDAKKAFLDWLAEKSAPQDAPGVTTTTKAISQ